MQVLQLQRGISVAVGEHPRPIKFMIHILEMFGHPVVLQACLGREAVVGYRLNGLSVLHDHIMNDIVGLTVWFTVAFFLLSFG